jgi:hypothetical protein
MNTKQSIILAVVIAAIAVIVVVGATMESQKKTENVSEKMKLMQGQESVFQYCSHIGKAVVDDPQCTEFNLKYGPK